MVPGMGACTTGHCIHKARYRGPELPGEAVAALGKARIKPQRCSIVAVTATSMFHRRCYVPAAGGGKEPVGEAREADGASGKAGAVRLRLTGGTRQPWGS